MGYFMCSCGLSGSKRPLCERSASGHTVECDLRREIHELNEKYCSSLRKQRVAEERLVVINEKPALGDIAIELLLNPTRIYRHDRQTYVDYGRSQTIKLRCGPKKHRELVERFEERSSLGIQRRGVGIQGPPGATGATGPQGANGSNC